MVQDQRSKQFESEANTSRHLLAVSGEKAKTASSRLRLKPSTKTRRVIRLPPAQGNAAQAMLGEQEARVLEFKPFLLHSVTYYDVTVAYRDRSVGHAPAGSGGRPENLHPGEVVVAMRAANMIVSLQRPGEATGDVRSPPPASAARGATGATEPRHRDRPSTTPPAGVAGVHGPYGVAEGSEPTQ